ncbi:anti-sigma factor family protein [Salisediminibacterium halotolerans]|uniref:Anti-sigma-W factor RsiW n=1 Tax=Salisediminibacterium halotolerans TaxID=517425 RepID=A0A1H9WV30_9BACI|nr:anti-sigma factor [Salisediminibacterium haloalkalitolerans]SES37684.1 Transmembrane transcriptional regulator (anti-sigma factor RsiW) [Salisediminibacterium haloalkalitolerans]
MACSKNQLQKIHRYMDEEMNDEEQKMLEEHVSDCGDCAAHLKEMRQTVAIVQSTSHFKAPDDITQNVMNQLPKQPPAKKGKVWLQKHPFMITAATFFLVFIISLASGFSPDANQIAVQGEGQFYVDESNGVVIVPEGEAIYGDIRIENGDLNVEGEVHGDVTLVNGEHIQASAGGVTGEIEEINAFYERIWHHTKIFISDVFSLSSDTTEQTDLSIWF